MVLQHKLVSTAAASVLGLETSIISLDLMCSDFYAQLCYIQVTVAKFHHLKSLLIR